MPVIRPVAVIAALLVLATPAAAHERYTVRWGDTLTGIAAARGTTPSKIARLNGFATNDLVLAGTRLRLPGPAAASAGRYRVRRGDTLSAIAARFGTTVDALRDANRIRNASLIFAGQALRVPGRGSGAGTRSVPVTAEPWSVRLSIDHWARVYGVDPRLARALSWMESGYQAHVVSSAGAWGAMQITPDAWDFVEVVLIGKPVPRTADGNVRVGVAYLDHLLHVFGGDERLALAAYYQGAEAVRRYGLFPETRAYVADVLGLKNRV